MQYFETNENRVNDNVTTIPLRGNQTFLLLIPSIVSKTYHLSFKVRLNVKLQMMSLSFFTW